MATLDVAYLLANINGWFTEKQEACFEKIAAQLGKRPSDVSVNAVGLNAKLAHLRNNFSEEDVLKTFITECQPYCEAFGGMLAPSRRAFALWITLGLADGEMTPMYRNALELLRLHKFLIWAAPSKIFLFFLILICKIPVSDLSYNWMCVERNFCLQLQK